MRALDDRAEHPQDVGPRVYVVHCVDTEGPLEESLEATFERLRKERGIDLPPDRDTLSALQNAAMDLSGEEKEIAEFLAPSRLAYLSSWEDVERMVQAITSESSRRSYADPQGNPYAFTWYIIDVVGYGDNPRRKALGWHVIWDKYQRLLRSSLGIDSLGWHFHTVPVGAHALDYNTCWTNNDWHEQVLARRIIERAWFPSTFRAGGVIERTDLSFWLEQFVPFDFSNCSQWNDRTGPGSQSDWRNAPLDWTAYHPNFYDYRQTGGMRRWIFRSLDVDAPGCKLTSEDVETAFERARSGKSAVVAYTDHDRRDLRPDVDKARAILDDVSAGYPDVTWEYANAHDAARRSLGIDRYPAPRFAHSWRGDTLFVESDQTLFGPQPFLAVEEEGGIFYRDNMTRETETSWAYCSPRLDRVRHIGIASANSSGEVGVLTIQPFG